MDKQKLYEIIDEKAPLLTELSDKIWGYAELSMLEYKSTAAYVQVLKEEGFEVTENLCNIPTAFSGSFGSGKPVIGILGEYDALSGLSQVAGATEKHLWKKTAAARAAVTICWVQALWALQLPLRKPSRQAN